MGIAIAIYIYALRYTLFPIYLRLFAAICDLRHTHTSDSIPTCSSVFSDTENVVLPLTLCC